MNPFQKTSASHDQNDLSFPIVDRSLRELETGVERLRTISELGDIISGFGSARLREDSPWYQAAVETARLLSNLGYIMLTGGGPGIMEAWNRGGFEANGLSIGCSIKLPNEQKSNVFLGSEAKFEYFFTRKILLMKGSSAIVCFPGGFGTLDELFEVLNLTSKGRMLPVPVVLFGNEFWKPHLKFLSKAVCSFNTLHPKDLNNIKIVDTPQELVDYIQTQKYRRLKDPNAKTATPNLNISEKMLTRAHSEFNNAMSILYTNSPYVSVSGANALSNGKYPKAAFELGRLLGENQMKTLISDTNPVTQFLNAGVVQGGGETTGFINPDYRGQTYRDPNLHNPIPVSYQFIREVLSHKSSSGTVLFPGGYGTLDRAFELLTLIQCEKVPNRPVIGFGSEFWQPLMDMVHEVHYEQFGTISKNDTKILRITDDPHEALEILRA